MSSLAVMFAIELAGYAFIGLLVLWAVGTVLTAITAR